METKSGLSALPPNYVTIKDLRERWLNRRQEQQQQQLQREQPETGKENGKQKQQEETESRSPSRSSLHTECVKRGAESDLSGRRARTGKGVGKRGPVSREPRVGYVCPGGRGGDRKPELGRWWSDKESQGLVAENVVDAVGTGVNESQEKEDQSRANDDDVVEEQKPPKKMMTKERVSVGNRGRDKTRLESKSLHFDGEAGSVAVLDVATEELQDEVLLRKGAGDRSRLKNKSRVTKNGEVVEGNGQDDAGKIDLIKKCRLRQSRWKRGLRDESRSKNKNMVGENRGKVDEGSSTEGLKDRNEIKGNRMAAQNGRLDEVVRGIAPAKSKKGRKMKHKGKSENKAYVESKVTEVEDAARVGDEIRVGLALEIEGQVRELSIEDNNRTGGSDRSVRTGRGKYGGNSHRRFGGRREVSNQIGGEMVWVKKGKADSSGGSQHSNASGVLFK